MRVMASGHASLYLARSCSLRINEQALQNVCSTAKRGCVDTGSR